MSSGIPCLKIYELDEKGMHLVQKESKLIHDSLGYVSGTMIATLSRKAGLPGKFCDEHGMGFSTSDVTHPWQNGLAEKSNQAIKGIAKKVLISGNVPTEFWVYAMKYEATVRNIVGVKVHRKIQSPFHMLMGQGVDIKDLHPFGCRAFVSKTQFEQNLSKQNPTLRPDWPTFGGTEDWPNALFHKSIDYLGRCCGLSIVRRVLYASQHNTCERSMGLDPSSTVGVARVRARVLR